jgi:hypothetical protein
MRRAEFALPDKMRGSIAPSLGAIRAPKSAFRNF